MNDIIEGLNQFYETFPNRRKGYFVLHKVIVSSNTVIKTHKTYRVQVWFVNKNDKIPAFGSQIQARVTNDTERNKIDSLLTIEFSKNFSEYLCSGNFKELCYDRNE